MNKEMLEMARHGLEMAQNRESRTLRENASTEEQARAYCAVKHFESLVKFWEDRQA